jgi:hypothetical protein
MGHAGQFSIFPRQFSFSFLEKERKKEEEDYIKTCI